MKIEEKKIPRKIDQIRSKEICRADMERYRLLAIELGAKDAKIVKSEQVTVENRVQGKCIVPKCAHYGMSLNCPPYTPTAEETKNVVREYQYGIFIRLIIPSDLVAGEKAIEDDRMGPYRKKLHEIVSKIESQAFYDGYHLAMGFGGGPCKKTFCPDVECSGLMPGKGCRYPLKARPSMESVGMDAFTMAANVGWDIYPVGKMVCLDALPHGTYLGLVLIY